MTRDATRSDDASAAGTAGFRLFTRAPAPASRAPCRPGRDGSACGVGGNPAPQPGITKDAGWVFA